MRLRQNGLHFPEDIFKCISWLKIYEFRLRFHWSVFLRVQIQHWFRWWFGAKQATSPYLDQCRHSLLTHKCVTWPKWVNNLLRPLFCEQICHKAYCSERKCVSGILAWYRLNGSIRVAYVWGLILSLWPANERRRYFVTPFLVGWAQA